MIKDEFKNHGQNEMTANDLDCGDLYNPRWAGKIRRKIRKLSRKRLKEFDKRNGEEIMDTDNLD